MKIIRVFPRRTAETPADNRQLCFFVDNHLGKKRFALINPQKEA